MSNIATYSFLPWMRQGLAGQISAADGDASVLTRATVSVDLKITGDSAAGGLITPAPVHRDVQLYGPGDVIGIDPRAIVRTDPRDWITNAEPNYLAHIEFYDEDLPWRYTPAAPSGDGLRLRPWLALIVLEEEKEFDRIVALPDRPLPSVDVKDPAALPAAGDLWAWAHVHVNASLSPGTGALVDGDAAGVASRLASAVAANRDVAYSRLVCPRRLQPNTRYRAFVVPTFETGRLAGLGLDPAGAPHATHSAWADYAGKPAGATLPIYHHWYFRTGDQGDFEYLVRIIEPRPLDARVGVRDVDLRHPGSNLRGVTDPATGGILKLGGALRVPDAALTAAEIATRQRFENWDQAPPAAAAYPQPFQQDMAAFVNLPDDYAVHPADVANAASGLDLDPGDPDPLITSPLYGRWHALTQRLLLDRDGNTIDPDDNWVHELNLDPRHRLAAGFGTRVMQANQEQYMDAAWGQIGDVIEANRRIRLAQLARLVSQRWWFGELTPDIQTRPERLLRLTAPANRHVLLADTDVTTTTPYQTAPGVEASTSGRATLRRRLETSLAGTTLVSAPMRRITRPGARLARRLPFVGDVTMATLLERVDAGEVSPAPPKITPPGVVTTDQVVDTVDDPALPSWVPTPIADWLLALLRRWRWLPWLVLGMALALIAVGVLLAALAGAVGLVVGLVLLVVGLLLLAVWLALRKAEATLDRTDQLRPGGLTVDAIDHLPAAPGFELIEPGGTPQTPPTGGGTDSATATRLKAALRDWARLYGASLKVGTEPVPAQFGRAGLVSLAQGTATAVEPAVTVPRRVFAGIVIPPHVVAGMTEDFGEVMAYPRVDSPMYEPLRDLSDEYLLPNLNLIPPNTISLLETNQPFIEAYMVGLNHEMARELLWREYPTDQRGTPFRQFWDATGALPAPGLTADQARESLYDIPELHRWPHRSHLGDHDHREKPGDNENEAVLVIRGELLKKYPTAIIYAHKARWEPGDGVAHPENERHLVELTAAQEAHPPDTIVKTPLYEARVSPDITFFGFDLTVPEAQGGDGSNPSDDAGWFFCIKERPGEPRFGFDIEAESSDPPETVNDVAWSTIGTPEGGFVPANALSPLMLDSLEPDDDEKIDQRADDVAVLAAAPASAARWAYISYQAPVLVAVHAAEMLRRENP